MKLRSHIFVIAASMATALGIALRCCDITTAAEDGEPTPVQSVLLITIDTLRADHLSGYGYPRRTSPNLDAFLEKGARFRYAFSTSPRTAPSHVSIMTGLYPSFHSVDIENSRYALHESFATLAEICRGAGVRTAAIVSNPILGRRLGLNQGFERYDDFVPRVVATRRSREKTAAIALKAALRELGRLRGERFFLWVHFQDPHGPYTAPGSFAARLAQESGVPGQDPGRVLAAGEDQSGYGALPRYQVLGEERRLEAYVRWYDAEIRYLDEQLKVLFETLEGQGLLQTTLVVVTADHGEAFGEDGFYCAHGHGTGLDQTRVPLGFVGPGVRSNAVFETPVSNLDIFATALDALGLDGERRQSRSLLRALRTGTEPAGRVGYAESVTQRALFTERSYLRKDRRPPTDKEFWSSRNPYTKAPHVPLGKPKLTILDPDRLTEGETIGASGGALLDQLLRFSDEADRAREELDSLRAAPRQPTGQEREALRALGYLE